jgi:hypothetical protein
MDGEMIAMENGVMTLAMNQMTTMPLEMSLLLQL